MVAIRKQLIASTNYSFGRANTKKFLTIHETGNTKRGANAAAHAHLQSRAGSEATWHWTVDDKEAVQSFAHDFQLWHAGDVRGDGNMKSIAIETCVNSDANPTKVRQNLIELAARIVVDENIARANIVQHNRWSGKDCPHYIREAGTWGALVAAIWTEAERLRGNSKPPAPKPGTAAGYIGKQIDIDQWWNYKTAADAAALRNAVRVMPAGRYEVTHVSGSTPHLRKTDGKASGWVHSSVLDNRPVVGGTTPTARTHTVVKGDTLWGIAQRYGTSVDKLRSVNGLKGDLILPGKVLKV